VRMTRTPSRVVMSKRWASTVAPRISGPGGGRANKKAVAPGAVASVELCYKNSLNQHAA